MIKIAPSILSANFADLGNEVKKLEDAMADLIHFDVMDGHFVPNITFGPMILSSLKSYTKIPFDVHLMVQKPDKFIPWYAKAGADIITFHLEASENPSADIELIHSLGIKAGVSIKPRTDIDSLLPYLNNLDLILIMSVEPGFGGQTFDRESVQRIQKIKKLIKEKNILIEVDGGINCETAPLCINAGADILVAGSAVFKNENYNNNISCLRDFSND